MTGLGGSFVQPFDTLLQEFLWVDLPLAFPSLPQGLLDVARGDGHKVQ